MAHRIVSLVAHHGKQPTQHRRSSSNDNPRGYIRPLQGHIRALAALGVTSLALIAASPANAIQRSYEPSDTMTASQSSAGSGADWMDMAELRVY